ncbi:MAG TPA: hypothetical protein VF557_13505 [Jatrophihabitans sp.]|jgi:hypothetical protein|uniref:hypothetical protein n=1 Tax=Jatrophihabitans sp. TaxID=1932789 RepID=UPI002F054596
MSLRRIAGVAVAAAIVASGAGLLLSGPSGAVTPPTPITLEPTGMTSPNCPAVPLGVYDSIALKPATVVQFKRGALLAGATSQSLTIKPAPNSADPNSTAVIAKVPTTGSTPITFSRATTYSLTWQSKADGPLGAIAVGASRTGKLVLNANARGCVIAVQIPVPSVSASAVPSPIISGINGAIGGVVSSANGALGPVNSALPTLPPAPTLPGVNPPVLSPPAINPPGASAPGGDQGPGTNYKPTGPTVADRTVPKGYGTGSGLGGLYVPGGGDSGAGGSATGGSITAPGQQPGAGNAQPAGSAQRQAKPGGSPETVELATSRPRSALGALPTLAVVLAILALSGATAFYARTFLLQPAQR